MGWERIADNRWRWLSPFRPAIPSARSALPMPHIISDEMPPTEQVDGKFYVSKSKFRAVGRSHGLTEVGTEKLQSRVQRASSSAANKRARREALMRAAAQYRAGRRIRNRERGSHG